MAQSIDSRTDVMLLKRIAEREMSAMSDLYDLRASLLYTVILRILRDEGEAEDTLQEVFFRIWERADTYKEALGPPAVWLIRISKNLAIDKLRSRVSRARKREVDLEAQIDLHDERPGSSPMQFAINSQQQQAVAEALLSLPQDQRVLIEHAYFQGYTQSELAEHFQLPLGTVKTRIRYREEIDVLAALHALGALDGEDERRFQQLRGEASRRELDLIDDYEKVAALIGLSSFPLRTPGHDVKKKILARIEGSTHARRTEEAAQGFSFVHANTSEWMKHPVEGVSFKQLSLDAERGYATLLFKVEPGTRYPAHHHTGPEECYVIQGDLHIGDVVLHAGDFTHADSGTDHVPIYTEHGCMLLLVVAAHDYLPS